jgi:DNA modification methylase
MSTAEKPKWEELGFETSVCSPVEVDFGNRVREDYGDIDGLGETFDMVGIINFIAVKRLPAITEFGQKYKLLAGGRRFFALLKKKIQTIPIRIYPEDTSEETCLLIEQIENVCRKDFSWQELLAMEEKVHDTQIQKHGRKVSTSKDAPGWTQQDTAKLLGQSPATLSENLKLVELLKACPEIASKAKNMSEAKAMLKAVKTRMSNQATLAAIETENAKTGIDGVRQQLCFGYQVKDALIGLKEHKDNTFDLIEIDPPYAIGFSDILEADGRPSAAMEYNEVPGENYIQFMNTVITESYRILKPEGWLLLWYAIDPWHQPMLDLLRSKDFKVCGIPAVWDKSKGSNFTSNPSMFLANSYEQFFYARKGPAKIQKPGRANIFSYPSPPAAHRIHPTERPVALLEDILLTFTKPGASVMVPFLGSGNTLLACANIGMQGTGFDLSQIYSDAFKLRVLQGIPGKYGKREKEKDA